MNSITVKIIHTSVTQISGSMIAVVATAENGAVYYQKVDTLINKQYGWILLQESPEKQQING